MKLRESCNVRKYPLILHWHASISLVPRLSPRPDEKIECNVTKISTLLAIPHSGLFLWGANFRYFCGATKFSTHEIFHPRNFPPMKFSTHEIVRPHCSSVHTCQCSHWATFCYGIFFCYLCPVDSALDP